ncbi:MAG TPA: type IV pilus assembly protein PilM [Pirellulales bacterium]|jgi:type IV pilus assembly protein PilM|nr:type IV pilus assembly protein PilM [Pirellulales bacterium]
MPTSDAVWGIDIGQSALKALRCSPHEQDGKLTADAFDFIEYPQILSQPDADPVTLVADALKTFLSRNNVKGDKVAVSVPGQSGLARYIKIPPVEAKKVPDLVKYEAKQQIPFALEDVIWDYQQMPGGVETEGIVLDTEVGLFAMKRDQVFKALKPFQDAGIEVDIVQLSPVAIYNFVNFDQISQVLAPAEMNGNLWVVVLSMGTDTTDLVVTNGGRMWQRSVPLGGNHFTRALTKEMKLTFAKAEHLKRNAAKAEDRRSLYQAMKSVFNDLVTEVHRSLSFFSSLEKEAEIKCVLAMGNTLKLEGLQTFLAKSLEYKVVGVESFKTLAGPTVVAAPAFRDNLLAYGVCYGLCVQALGDAKLNTNLLPREILQERLIRAKKPWAIAAAAILLFGCGISFFGYFRALDSVLPKKFANAITEIKSVDSKGQDMQAKQTAKEEEFKRIDDLGKDLINPARKRAVWLEMFKAVNQCLPQAATKAADPKAEPPADLTQRDVIFVDSLDCQYFEKLEDWFAGIKPEWENQQKIISGKAPANATPAAPDGAAPTPAPAPAGTAAAPATPAPGATAETPAGEEGPKGPGWVIEIKAHHYHNKDERNFGLQYVRTTLVKAIENKTVTIPQFVNGKVVETSLKLKDLGIGFPVTLGSGKTVSVTHPEDVQAEAREPRGGAIGGAIGRTTPITERKIDQFDFTLQFCWKETPYAQRQEDKKKAQENATAAAGQPAKNGGE